MTRRSNLWNASLRPWPTNERSAAFRHLPSVRNQVNTAAPLAQRQPRLTQLLSTPFHRHPPSEAGGEDITRW
jgi:hypothetical protein